MLGRIIGCRVADSVWNTWGDYAWLAISSERRLCMACNFFWV